MEIKKYPTSQPDLYTILRTLWQNCLANLAMFTAFKAFYTTTYVNAKLAAIDAAELLPDDVQRAYIHKQKRKELFALAKTACNKWQALKHYIESAFAPEFVEMNLVVAGSELYAKASDSTWSALADMMTKGSQYLSAHSAELIANNNMPAGFEEEFNEARAAVISKRAEFIHAEEQAPIGASAKVSACNGCYTDGLGMGTDGQYLAGSNEEMRKLFSFEAVRGLLDPDGAATLIITTMNGSTQMPQAGAEISIQGSDKTGISDAEGKTPFTQMPAGPGTAKITADGFPDMEIDFTLTAGTTTRITVDMQPLFTGEMTVGSEGVASGAAVGSGSVQ